MNIRTGLLRFKEWLLQDSHRRKARQLRNEVERAFTEHPHEAGESYLQHLWFTLGMCLRFVYVSAVILIHGVFPFLFTREASRQMERTYAIMKARIPKQRRDEIDENYDI